MIPKTIVPKEFRIEYLNTVGGNIEGILISIAAQSNCPICQTASGRIQSQYQRTVAELPWSGVRVIFSLQVRRFYCDNPECLRKIFTERLPELVRPYGRKTYRLEKTLQVIAYAEGGESGARTAKELGMLVSADTLLNQIRQTAVNKGVKVRVLGVDDWALRKGQRYGTILVDLESGCPIDLLPDREVESFANWLKEHPEVEIISRDRGQYYAQGGRIGAPTAIHVADRFHLLQNMTDAIERLLICHYQTLEITAQELAQENQPQAQPSQENNPEVIAQIVITKTDDVAPEVATKVDKVTQARRERRLKRYQNVTELANQEVSIREIARQTRLSRVTIRRFLKAGTFPEVAKTKRNSKIDPYLSYLQKQWEAGCDNACELWAQITKLGFRGSLSLVRRSVANWRKHKQANPPKAPVPSARRTAFSLLGLSKEQDEIKKKQQENFITRLCTISIEIKRAQELGQQFIQIVRERKSVELDSWLSATITSGLTELKNFAEGLLRDGRQYGPHSVCLGAMEKWRGRLIA